MATEVPRPTSDEQISLGTQLPKHARGKLLQVFQSLVLDSGCRGCLLHIPLEPLLFTLLRLLLTLRSLRPLLDFSGGLTLIIIV